MPGAFSWGNPVAERDVIVTMRANAEKWAADMNAKFAGIAKMAETAGGATTQAFAPAAKAVEDLGQAGVEASAAMGQFSGAVMRLDDAIETFSRSQAVATSQITAAKAAFKAGAISEAEYTASVLRTKAALGVARAEYRAVSSEVERLARNTNEASRGMAPLPDAMQHSTNSAENMRFGMQQLGYQLGDMATMFAMGARPMQIFASQGSQVIQSVQAMAGSTGKLATFLGGPWGIALQTATIALVPLIGKMFEAEDAANAMGDAAQEALKKVYASLNQASDMSTALTEISRKRITAMGDEAKAVRDLENAEANLKALRGAFGVEPEAVQGAEQVAAAAERRLQDARRRKKESEDELQSAMDAARVRSMQEAASDRLDANPRARRERSRGLSDVEKEQVRAAKERTREIERAWDAEEAFRKTLSDGSKAIEDQVRVEEIRTSQGEVAAAQEEARLGFLRENPLAVHRTVEELAVALGLTKDLTTAQNDLNDATRGKLQADIDNADFLEKRVADRAGEQAQAKLDEQAKRAADKAAEEMRRAQEDAIRDVASLYEDLFTGGVDKVWKDFKSIGLRVISEVAAEWTLAQISGQSMDVGQAMSSGFNSSPLGSLFNGGRALFGGTAANDNGKSGTSAKFAEAFKGADWSLSSTSGSSAGASGGSFSSLGQAIPGISVGLAAGSMSDGIMDAIGIKSSGTGASIGGVLGSFVGGPIGAVVGSIIGGVLGGIVKKTKKASSTIGGSGDSLSILSTKGNSSSRKEASIGMGNSVLDSIQQIADALGADVDGSVGHVSIGVRKKSYRVDPTGSGATKVGSGAVDFGSDQEAAVRYAIQNLLEDGVLTGISAASLKILKSGQELEKAIEKAALIESVPKLLKQRLDPLGFALDEIDAKFRDLAEALQEGGASADQIAQARQLWQLEREDTIKQIGAASATLKDFLQSLAVGSNSPLSLRQQEEAARTALAPYEQQIQAAQSARAEVDRLKAGGASDAEIKVAEEAARVAAGKIDQSGFQEASQALLDIKRSIDASSGNFFNEFDRIRNETGLAISLIEAGATQTSASGADPFTQAIAASTADTANILTDQSAQLSEVIKQLQAMNDNFVSNASLWAARGFV